MSLLGRLEKALERLVEGSLTGLFRGKVHPLELARELASRLQQDKRVSVSRTYVPNRFRVILSPDDREVLGHLGPALVQELVEYLAAEAARRDFFFAGPVEILLEPSPARPPGSFQVEAAFAPLEADSGSGTEAGMPPELGAATVTGAVFPSPGPPVAPAPAPPPAPASEAKTAPHPTPPPFVPTPAAPGRPPIPGPCLEVVEGFGQGQALPLVGRRWTLGRGEDATLRVGDPRVSRRHAELFYESGSLVIRDLGSRNGTRVNEESVTQCPLTGGDRIQVGDTVLVVHER